MVVTFTSPSTSQHITYSHTKKKSGDSRTVKHSSLYPALLCRAVSTSPCFQSPPTPSDTYFFFFFLLLLHFYFPASGQAVVTGVVPSSPRFLPSIIIAHRVQQSHCSSIFHRVLLTHALALSASQVVHKKKSQRIYTSMHSAGLQLTKLTYLCQARG